MKLKTEELRRYLSASSQIKPNPTATNLDSIKIECTGTEIIFTKTNNNIWCRYNYVCPQQDTCCYLINEKLLNGIALTTKEAYIDINLNDEATHIQLISGGGITEIPNQDLKLFPIIQMANGDRIKIDRSVVERIRIASKYVFTGPAVTAFNFVSIGMNGIFATNGNIVYYHNTFPLPDIMLDHEPLNIIKGTDDIFYWSSESYNFFQTEDFIYGFIKSVINPIKYSEIVNQTGTAKFICQRTDLIDFCTLVQYSKRQENPLASFFSITESNNTALALRFNDPDFNIKCSLNIPIEANSQIEQFNFNVELLSLMLRTLPYELLIFTKVAQGHYIVTTNEDCDYKGIIARLSE